MRTTSTAPTILGRLCTLILAATTFVAVSAMPSAHAGSSIEAVKVKGDLRQPAGFSFLPNGKVVYLERATGQVRFLNLQTKYDRRFFTIPGVNGSGERGALGVAVHPKWPEQPYIYVYVTRSAGGDLRNQIVRIKSKDGDGVAMKVILSTPASSDPYHNGGRIEFGPDGKLYAIVGDGHSASNAQDLTGNLRGKILRLRADGGVPADNPSIGGDQTKIFAYGIRNSFGFTFDPDTDDLWETENGPECNDEINLVTAGENYGWGQMESCPNTNQDGPSPVGPIYTYGSTIGITGATFCDGCGLGACCDGGSLHRAVLNGGRDDFDSVVFVFDAPGGSIHSMESAPDGRIYFSDGDAIYRLRAVA
jgi:glucose/arabinose dehydrogenase